MNSISDELYEAIVRATDFVVGKVYPEFLGEKYEVVDILVDRAERYGDPRMTFSLIAAAWSRQLGISVSPEQVAALMRSLKLVRNTTAGGDRDSILDEIGYAVCARLCSGLPVGDDANPRQDEGASDKDQQGD